ncbi:GbsR/MarR family transcriptional regulator [Microbacterium luticocti]|uniref:GbsR/MarR family transcriptional regulator n=1 Tax=Microbacterium luticocti TaxID=451764 RepID=UPI00040259C4|nr:MarR family transcriptional regulator [Microbacterium luticocti]
MTEHRAIEAAEQAAAAMATAGMPRMPARVLMALLAAPTGGYTAADLRERLGVSAAAVSGAVRYLQTLHFIRRRSLPGHRRERYEVVSDSWFGVMTANAPTYLRLAELIDAIRAAQDDPDAGAHAREMSDFLRFMARRMPELVKEWEVERAAGSR